MHDFADLERVAVEDAHDIEAAGPEVPVIEDGAAKIANALKAPCAIPVNAKGAGNGRNEGGYIVAHAAHAKSRQNRPDPRAPGSRFTPQATARGFDEMTSTVPRECFPAPAHMWPDAGIVAHRHVLVLELTRHCISWSFDVIYKPAAFQNALTGDWPVQEAQSMASATCP